MRITSYETIYTLCGMFDLPEPEDFSINWAHEYSISPDRIPVILEDYDVDFLNEDERFGLMDFLLNSVEFFLRKGIEPSGLWDKMVSAMKSDPSITRELIDYWSCPDYSDDEMEDAFIIAPRMRFLAKEISR